MQSYRVPTHAQMVLVEPDVSKSKFSVRPFQPMLGFLNGLKAPGLCAIALPFLVIGVAAWIGSVFALKALDGAIELAGGSVSWGSYPARMAYGFGIFAPIVLTWMVGATLWQLAGRVGKNDEIG